MSTELASPPTNDTLTITITQPTVEKLRSELDLIKNTVIQGIAWENGDLVVRDASAMVADKEGQKKVRESIKTLIKARTTCEKEHKAIKEQALRECQRIDKSRRDLLAIISEVEDDFVAIENAVETELDRIAKVEADKIYFGRIKTLAELGASDVDIELGRLREVDDDAFAKYKETVVARVAQRAEEEAERQRQAEANRIEQERLAAENARLAAERDANEKKLADERKKFEEEMAAERARQAVLKDEQDRQLAEQKRAYDEQQKALENARLELERAAKLQADQAEANRLQAENQLAQERNRLEADRQEMVNRERAQKEEQDRLTAEREQLEHEREQAEIRATVEKLERDTHETMSPYAAIKSVEEWHRLAAVDVVQWLRSETDEDLQEEMKFFWNLHESDAIEKVAGMIFMNDPAMV